MTSKHKYPNNFDTCNWINDNCDWTAHINSRGKVVLESNWYPKKYICQSFEQIATTLGYEYEELIKEIEQDLENE